MIFISTGGHHYQIASKTAEQFLSSGIKSIELSGGKYSADYNLELKILMNKGVKFQVHNYFPPPPEPFVFNLASIDKIVLEKSIKQVKSAIQLAVELERPLYSFHAGFRINPKVSELGNKLDKNFLRNRIDSLNQFGDQVLKLAEIARQQGVKLLIENNVINKNNFSVFGDDPLLLTDPNEIESFMKEMPNNVGLLLDVAHLKVSGQTLGFDKVDAHEKLKPWIGGYHFSDNDGLEDTNEPVNENSWYWNFIKPDLDYYSIEVYGIDHDGLKAQFEMVKDKITKNFLRNNK